MFIVVLERSFFSPHLKTKSVLGDKAMRIRKRFSPLSSSDPQLISRPSLSALQEEVIESNTHQSHPQNRQLQQFTGQEMMIGVEIPILGCHLNSTTQEQMMMKKEIEGKDERRKEEVEKIKSSNESNDISKESISSAKVKMQLPRSLSSSCEECDKWGEGDRVVPLKKRKGSYKRLDSKEMMMIIKPKMKSKTNKKCLQLNSTHNEVQDHDAKNSTKKIKRGNVIMEGSRCSRVNGRGWRCCQPTLVGYSLCEHHLGKGRLRSINSVRNHAMAQNQNMDTENAARLLLLLPSPDEKEDLMVKSSSTSYNASANDAANEEEEEEDGRKRKTLMSRKNKKMKIGAVKARSIRSLLGQTDNASDAAPNTNKK